MDRFGDHRLSSAGLTFEQDDGVRVGNPWQRLEDPAHCDRSAERSSKGVLGRQRLLGFDLDMLEAQRRLADLEHGAGHQVGALDAAAGEHDTIGRPDIAEQHPFGRRGDCEVIARHGGIGELQLIAKCGAARKRAFRIVGDETSIGPIDHAQPGSLVAEGRAPRSHRVGHHTVKVTQTHRRCASVAPHRMARSPPCLLVTRLRRFPTPPLRHATREIRVRNRRARSTIAGTCFDRCWVAVAWAKCGLPRTFASVARSP